MNNEKMSAQGGSALGGKTKKLAYWASVTTLGIVLGVSLQFVKAWTEPTAPAPAGNVGAPINTSAVPQTKNGVLNISSTLGVTGVISALSNVVTEGKVQSDLYCDKAGNNCKPVTAMGSTPTCPCGACWVYKEEESCSTLTRYGYLCTPTGWTMLQTDGALGCG